MGLFSSQYLAFLSHFRFWKGICKVASWIGLEILVPKHPWKSKIRPLQPILAAKRYVSFFKNIIFVAKTNKYCILVRKIGKFLLQKFINVYALIDSFHGSAGFLHHHKLCRTGLVQWSGHPYFENKKILINFHTIISLCVGAGLHFLLVDKPDSIFLVVDKPDRQIPFIWVGGQSSKPKGENYDDDDDHDENYDDDDADDDDN